MDYTHVQRLQSEIRILREDILRREHQYDKGILADIRVVELTKLLNQARYELQEVAQHVR